MSNVRIDITIHVGSRTIVHNCYPPVVDDTTQVAKHIQKIVDSIAPGARYSVSNPVVEEGAL